MFSYRRIACAKNFLSASTASSALQIALPVMAMQTLPLACAQPQSPEMNIGGMGMFPKLYPSQALQIAEFSRGYDSTPQVANLKNGNKVLAWLTPIEDDYDGIVTVQYVDQNGMKVGNSMIAKLRK